MSIEAIDLRPEAVNYTIGIECGAVGPNPVYVERTILQSDAISRTALLDNDPTNDVAIVTFQSSEAGEYLCRPIIKDASNPPTSQGAVWRTYFRQASLNVLSPTAFPSCLDDDNFEIRAVGQNIDGNQPILFYRVTPTGGSTGEARLLTGAGNNLYTANVASLADGRYTLSFEGTILSEVPVAFVPEQLEIVVNRNAPTLNIVTPIAERFEDSDSQSPGTQVAVEVDVCGAGGQTIQLNTVPVLSDTALTAVVPEGAECSRVTFPTLNIPLGDIALTASVADECGVSVSAERTASVDPSLAFAQIRSLDSGDRINAAQDNDAARSGCQLAVRVETNGVSTGASFAVCTSNAVGQPDENCLGLPNVIDGQCQVIGAGSVEGSTLMECPVSLPDAAHELSFVAVEGGRVQSSLVSVVADCSPPEVISATVPEDVDENGCVNAREKLPENFANDFTVQVRTNGLADGTRVELRDGLNNLFGFGLTSGETVTIAGSLPSSQSSTTLTILGEDGVGNDLIGQDGQPATLDIRVDSEVPQMTASNLGLLDCLGIASDAEQAQGGLQFTPILDVTTTAGEQVNVEVRLDGIAIFQSGPAEISRVNIPQLSLPDGNHTLVAVVSDTCGNQGSAYGFDQVNGVDDWASPVANAFSIDTVAPSVSLGGIDNERVFTADEDVDNDSSNGFQVAAQVVVDALAPLEEGQVIEVLSNGSPLSTIPTPLLMGNDPSADQLVSLTLAAGAQVLTVTTVDACGNVSPASPELNVTLDVNGCASRFNGFDSNPQVLTASDGTVVGAALETDINAQVDIFDAACVGATAQLLVDDAVVATQAVPAGGALVYSAIPLASGSRNLKVRVSEASLDTVDSLTQVAIVDINAPAIEFVSPVDGAAILTDADGNLANNQQISIVGTVTEVSPATTRTVTLSVDGQAVDSLVIDNGIEEQVSFDQTLLPGVHELQLCVADEANAAECTSVTVNADPAVPGDIVDLQASIIDARAGQVELSFTAPGDDGQEGTVTGYAIRVVEKSNVDAAVTASQWNAAVNSQLVVNDVTQVGGTVTVTIQGQGPGSLSTRLGDGTDQLSPHGDLGLGLIPNQRHFLAIAAIDDATDLDAGADHPRLGAFAEVTVDLRWSSETYDIQAIGGAWDAGGEYGLDSPITAVGDVDNSGTDDVLVTFFKFSGGLQSTAALVLGDVDPSQTSATLLSLPANFGYATSAAGGQDLNGDGIPDFAIGGFTGDFLNGLVVVYLGIGNDQAELLTPDAVYTVPGRLLGGLSMIGNFHQRSADTGNFADLFVGGQVTPGGTATTAWVIAGRAVWDDLTIETANNPTADNTNRTNGITTIETTGVVIPGLSGVGIDDLNGDNAGEIVFSAGGSPGFVFFANGGTDLAGRLTLADGQLAIPSCMNESNTNESTGFGFSMAGGADLDGVAGSDFAVSNLENTIAVIDQDLSEVDCFTFGRYRFGRDVSLAGDLNGDGFEDLVAAHGVQNDPAQATSTNAYVFFNNGTGTFGIPYNSGVQRYAHMRLDALTFTTGADNYETGLSGVSGVGDFNGDGIADLGSVMKQTGAGSLQLVIYY
ncbi:MAG: hypothetical protein ACPGQS_08300 [Bradymonadia bacterium]